MPSPVHSICVTESMHLSGLRRKPGHYSAADTNAYTDDADVALMVRIGFDSVRLSIDAVPLEEGPQNNEGFNPDFIGRLDHAVNQMLAKGMAVQIDIHPESDYKKKVSTTGDGVERFLMLWHKLAAHYADRNPDLIFYEIMNSRRSATRIAGRRAGARGGSASVLSLRRTRSLRRGRTGRALPTC